MRLSKANRVFVSLFGLACAASMTTGKAQAAIYSGNGAGGFGGTLGGGSVSFTDNGAGMLTATFNPNGGFTGNDVVLYIDSVAGGFANNSTFFDNADGGRTAVSGSNNGNSSHVGISFPAGFGADYALEFENTSYMGLFGLASGGNGSLNYVTGAAPSGGTFSVTFPLASIGLTQGQSFSFVGDLISTSAYGSNETVGASTTIPGSSGDTPNAGFGGSVIFSSADTYSSTAVPEPTSLLAIGFGGLALLARRTRNR